MAAWKNLFGTKSQAAVTDAGDATLQHATAVLVDPVTGQPPAGGQPVNILPYIGDQSGDGVAIPNGSASSAKALPAGTTRLSMFVDCKCYMRMGGGAVAATTASFPMLANVPYEFAVRPGEGYISLYGAGASGTANWGRLDAS